MESHHATEHWVNQLRTHTDHAALPERTREALFGEIGYSIDRFGGSFTMSYTTVLFAATRR